LGATSSHKSLAAGQIRPYPSKKASAKSQLSQFSQQQPMADLVKRIGEISTEIITKILNIKKIWSPDFAQKNILYRILTLSQTIKEPISPKKIFKVKIPIFEKNMFCVKIC
jgi:hypothetical protein